MAALQGEELELVTKNIVADDPLLKFLFFFWVYIRFTFFLCLHHELT